MSDVFLYCDKVPGLWSVITILKERKWLHRFLEKAGQMAFSRLRWRTKNLEMASCVTGEFCNSNNSGIHRSFTDISRL